MKILITLMFFVGFACAGEALISKNGCLECHQTRGAKLAPGWMGISKKASSMESLIETIKTGSKGKYPNPKFQGIEMPSFGHLKDDEIKSMAEWIYNLRR